MKLAWLVMVLAVVVHQADLVPFGNGRQERNYDLESYLRGQLEPFRSQMSEGIPYANLQPLDPYNIKKLDFNLEKFSVLLDVSVTDLHILGMSRFTQADIEAYENRISMKFVVPNVEVNGNYDLRGHLTWLPGAKITGNGPLVGKVGVVTTKVDIDYEIRDNKIEIQKVETDMDFKDVKLKLKKLLEGNFVAPLVATYIDQNAATYLSGMKDEPEKLMTKVMENVYSVYLNDFYLGSARRQKRQLFTCSNGNVNAILDNVIEKSRPFLKFSADPFPLPNTNVSGYVFLHDGIVNGLSSLYRSGDSELICDDKEMMVKAKLGLETFSASYNWTIPILFYNFKGQALIRVANATADAVIRQKRQQGANPIIENLDLKLGNFGIDIQGLGQYSQYLSTYVTLIGSLFKDQLTGLVGPFVKSIVQQQLDGISLPF